MTEKPLEERLKEKLDELSGSNAQDMETEQLRSEVEEMKRQMEILLESKNRSGEGLFSRMASWAWRKAWIPTVAGAVAGCVYFGSWLLAPSIRVTETKDYIIFTGDIEGRFRYRSVDAKRLMHEYRNYEKEVIRQMNKNAGTTVQNFDNKHLYGLYVYTDQNRNGEISKIEAAAKAIMRKTVYGQNHPIARERMVYVITFENAAAQTAFRQVHLLEQKLKHKHITHTKYDGLTNNDVSFIDLHTQVDKDGNGVISESEVMPVLEQFRAEQIKND
jgi:uncharacterized protein YktA (UPF0223 family)